MRILAIDTSSKSVSVALLEQQTLISELDSTRNWHVEADSSLRAGANDVMAQAHTPTPFKRRSGSNRMFGPGASTLLAPMIKAILTDNNVTFSDVDLIAVTTGPGLFTGLRVGVVTAKSLAYATGTDLIGVNTLEVVAAQTAIQMVGQEKSRAIEKIRVVINAQRNQLFCGLYSSLGAWETTALESSQILDRGPWMNQLQAGDVVTGSGLKPIADQVVAEHPEVIVAPQSVWNCTANGVGQLAWRQFQNGKRDDLWKLKPNYFRPSAAEEKRDAQKSG